jgi:RHS repeat-associated protein
MNAPGGFALQTPLLALPGVPGGGGSVDVGVSYRQDLAAGNGDVYGLGAGWVWNMPRVNVDSGVQVSPASGGVFDADASKPSGLNGYVLEDLVFAQTPGVLPERDSVGVVEYAYSLVYRGGLTDYFNTTGDLVARVDGFNARVDYVWDEGASHRLIAVIDGAGNRATINWTGVGVEIVTPQRSDGVVAKTVLETAGGHLISVTDPTEEKVVFTYQDTGLLERVVSGSGAVTEVSYQTLPSTIAPVTAVDQVRVIDQTTGATLSTREWDALGDHNAQGNPTYTGEAALWGSGDDQYRYQTQLSDGATNVVSEYNSLGVMRSRQIVVSSSAGNVTAQEQQFVYPGTEDDGVPDPQNLPKQYTKPTQTTVVSRDDRGRTRNVSEHAVFDDTGRPTKQVTADGAITETLYDDTIPEGMLLPVGLMVEQTTTGVDGTIAKTVNTLTLDHKTVQATETLVGTTETGLTSKTRTEATVQPDGFLSEQRVIATGEVAEGPTTVVTRFDRTVDDTTGTVTLTQTSAVDTPAESTVSTVVDKTTGLTLKAVDATGRHASTTYDVAGRPVTETGPTGNTTTTEYGEKVTRVTDSLGVTVSEYVNVLGEVVKTTDNITVSESGKPVPTEGVERVVETREYEQNSSKVTVTDERGLETVTISDVFGRPLRVTGPTGVAQVTEYDDVANTVRTGQTTTGSGLTGARIVIEKQMDDSNRTVSETGQRKDTIPVPESTTTFDGLGRTRTQVAADVSTNVLLNPDGTPKTTTTTPVKPDHFPGEQVTADREHDLMGVPTKKTLTKTGGETRPGATRVLDAAGQTVSETDQAGQTTSYEYTVDGLIAETRNHATGVVTRNTYDPVTRAVTLTETVAADGTVSRTRFEYDPVTGAMTAVFDPTDHDRTQVRYEYDLYGNTTQVTYPDGKTIQHSFDEYGRQETSTDITGNITTNKYDRVGLLTHATQTTPDGKILSEVGYEYDQYGRTTTLTRNNNVTTRYTFTSADQIKTETTKNGDTVILDAAYEYDTHGNLTKRVDTRQNDTTLGQETPGLVTETTVYTYNAYNQLTTSAIHPGTTTDTQPTLRTQYEIGVSGDVTKETTTQNGTITVREFETNPQGQTTAITTNGVRAEQTYDLTGNLTHGADGTTYTYDVHNQPLTETRTNGSTTQHTYWITGQRSSTTDSSDGTGVNTTGMYWDGATLVNDTHTTGNNPGNTQTVSYLIGATRHTRTLTGTDVADPATGTEYYVTDRHGNITATTNTNGDTTRAYTYTDYGVPTEHTTPGQPDTSATRNPFQYAGEYTTETGNQYLGARTYNPKTTTFTTKDVAEQFNLYAYANSNPVTMVDPTGQTPDWDTIINGIFIGVSILATIATAGLFLAPAVTLWTGIGVAVSTIVEGVAVGMATAQIIDDNVDGVDFITDETSEILTWAGIALGIASLGLTTAAGAAGAAAKTSLKAASVVDSYLEYVPESYKGPLKQMTLDNPEWVKWFREDMNTLPSWDILQQRQMDDPLKDPKLWSGNIEPFVIDIRRNSAGQHLKKVYTGYLQAQERTLMHKKLAGMDIRDAYKIIDQNPSIYAPTLSEKNYANDFFYKLLQGTYRKTFLPALDKKKQVPWTLMKEKSLVVVNNQAFIRGGWAYN